VKPPEDAASWQVEACVTGPEFEGQDAGVTMKGSCLQTPPFHMQPLAWQSSSVTMSEHSTIVSQACSHPPPVSQLVEQTESGVPTHTEHKLALGKPAGVMEQEKGPLHIALQLSRD